jgi:hypothetical protein
MLVAAVLCLCAAAATAAVAGWTLTRPHTDDPVRQVLRAVAPTQFAASAMLTAGGVVALAKPEMAALVLTVCVLGAIGTVAAGCWQNAKLVARAEAEQELAKARSGGDGGCAGSCASCTLSCS